MRLRLNQAFSLMMAGACSLSLPSAAQTISTSSLLEKIPLLIIESCLDKSEAALSSNEFVDCLTETVVGEKIDDQTFSSDPTHRPSSANYEETGPARLSKENLVVCTSKNASYTPCEVPNVNRKYVQLLRQTSVALCKLNESWGVSPSHIWTNKGCGGIFYYGSQPYPRKSISTVSASSKNAKPAVVQARSKGLVVPIPQLPEFTKDGWRKCALEFQVCEVPYPTTVRFGRPGKFYEKRVEDEVHCRTAVFGDPDPSAQKACYYKLNTSGTAPAASPPAGITAKVLPPLKNTQLAPSDEEVLIISEPLWRARMACTELGRQIIFSKQNTRTIPIVYLGLGFFNKPQLDQKPVLARTGDKLAGRGIYEEQGAYVPFTFSCALNRNGRKAEHFVFQRQNADVLTQDLLPNPESFSSEPQDDVIDGQRIWAGGEPVNASNPQAVLVHGTPETDDIDFFAQCTPGSGQIEVQFQHTIPLAKEKDSVLISLKTRRFAESFAGTMGPLDEEAGAPLPHLDIPVGSGLWNRMARDNELQINIAGYAAYNVSLKGSARPVRNFVRACNKAN